MTTTGQLPTIKAVGTLALGVLSLVAAATLPVDRNNEEAFAGTTAAVSVDLHSDSNNTASTVGAIDDCRALSPGSSVVIDIVIQDVNGLSGFQMELTYDPAVMRIVPLSDILGLDYRFILSASSTTSVLDLGDLLPDDGDGSFTLAAAQFPSAPVSGSGVMVRLKIEAVASGSTAVSLSGVKLSSGTGTPLQPSDANGFYTGPVNGATVVVGSGCADLDGDGVSDGVDNCPAWPNPSQELPPWFVPDGDSDCDGFSDVDEIYFGTDPNGSCGYETEGEQSLTWPADLYASNHINTTDVLAFKAVFGQDVPAVAARFDLFPDGTINTTDVLQMKQFFGHPCTP
ncbi:MAG TPA: cohesin domain-containing protein [Dehalococcoidia bacterium]|nr:cohesin domain-containing protein [Dehalococcoidia bacterium]